MNHIIHLLILKTVSKRQLRTTAHKIYISDRLLTKNQDEPKAETIRIIFNGDQQKYQLKSQNP